MNTPQSREGNVIRYAVYLAGYVAVFAVVKLVTRKSPAHIWDLILFGLVAAMILLFYVYRFNREQRFFARDFKLPWLGSLSTVVLLTLVITVTQISISYLQSYGRISHYDFQLIYAKSESVNMFWFLIVVQGIVLPILQEFLATGFLFNYAFRRNTKQVAIMGIIVSGLIYSLLSFQNSVVLFIIDAIYGMVFAWSYMYTQTLLMPIYLAVVSGVLTVIMI
ncbi:CPBP family intramembrane glutamic endopeptidase [Lactobacillus crispatus]|uniref:CPBP family intramembrane glutamic endopeptidase n=1 Tax=Lactobacillus crispatus TaxID=47770 RepID=UPI0001B2A3FA|nr:CPBP family intramembrane glutamic endopeptidase [Lactobacillus crispatus]EEU18622.1 CAAX amino terminal protease family protein [Lactobacillus crispatus 125-2-CHN]MCT7687186.1 CPBP family intramembrane metalloprotease [Lactobacillus crispatus]MCT7731789.1 CPBP family intramembrane metalloprotease [Lactobacillus crispatus]MCT7742347.1 CPBP family intramembrane metalloprotease [Lactobacillus crispatus]MCT7748175.1 CPBP family intramembrane metalloprotease [Lactobacillus crispatus]